MDGVKSEIAATAARMVVEEGLENGPAKRRAVKQLGLNARSPLPDNDAIEDSVREYRGWYTWRFEQSEFVACGAAANDSPWWVIPSDDALRERDSLAALVLPPGGQRALVRVRGLAGPRTIAGHMGRSTRYFRIFAVKEMRPDTAACGRKA